MHYFLLKAAGVIEVSRTALLPYSDEQLFALVNNVEDYPLFMNGCLATKVFESSAAHMVAELTLSKAGLKRSFTTRNTLLAPERIVMALEDGPFEEFEGVWTFTGLSPNACKVSFDLRFSMKGSLATRALGALIKGVGSDMIDAVSNRAKQVYGE